MSSLEHGRSVGSFEIPQYPECPLLTGTGLDGAFRRLWDSMNQVPPEEQERRRRASERVEAAYKAREAERLAEAAAKRKPTADRVFLEAFDKAALDTEGMDMRARARHIAKHTAKILLAGKKIDGKTIERATGIFARHADVVRDVAARLAWDIDRGADIQDPLSILDHRCRSEQARRV